MNRQQTAQCGWHRFFQVNVAVGLILFAAMVYAIATGDYATIAERREAESVFNAFSIGGLIYAATFFAVDFFLRPLVCDRQS